MAAALYMSEPLPEPAQTASGSVCPMVGDVKKLPPMAISTAPKTVASGGAAPLVLAVPSGRSPNAAASPAPVTTAPPRLPRALEISEIATQVSVISL